MNSFDIQGHRHFMFVCKNLKKTTKMFKKIFNAEEVYSSHMFAFAKEKILKFANVWIALMEGEPREKTDKYVTFYVNAENLPRIEASIRAFGLPIISGKNEQETGGSLYFYDFDKNLFKLQTQSLIKEK